MLFAVAVTGVLTFNSCDEDDPEMNPTGSNLVIVTQDIEDVTTWYGDSIYLIKKYDFYVENTLIIQAGTIIKFHPSAPSLCAKVLLVTVAIDPASKASVCLKLPPPP